MKDALLVTIGVESPEVEKIRALGIDARIVSYPGVPDTYAFDGEVQVESPKTMGKFLNPRAIVYYGYFEGPEVTRARRAIALSKTPSFPDLRRAIFLDDRAQATVLTSLHDFGETLPRGYLPANMLLGFDGERVAKWGNRHAGEGKIRFKEFETVAEESIVEPFIRGESERILLIGDRYWHLRYHSEDWRKNVRSTVEILPLGSATTTYLYQRAVYLMKHLGLSVAGVDFIVDSSSGRAYLLEVNAYPGFEDVPEASDEFARAVAKWWVKLS